LAEPDLLAVEEPRQIRVGEHNLAVTMRTPGNDAELAAGFLFTEGFVQSSSEIIDIECSSNTVCITLAQGVRVDPDRAERNSSITSSCGVCGNAA
jgi:FdhD protein